MVNKVTFAGFRGANAPIAPLDPPLSLLISLVQFSLSLHSKFLL